MFLAYKSAMQLGSVAATIRMAKIYEKGEHGVEVDKEKALSLYEEVAHDDVAINSIGSILYEKGQFKRAAE
jgi:TPR repeat protein